MHGGAIAAASNRPSALMRDCDDKQGFILDLEQNVEREPGKHAFPERVVAGLSQGIDAPGAL